MATWTLYVWPSKILAQSAGWRAALEIVGLAAAVATCIYTGILIGNIMSRPFGNSPLLPVLFLISAVSTGVAAILFVPPVWYGLKGTAVPETLAEFMGNAGKVDAGLIVQEAIVIYLYFAVVFDRAPEAANLLLRGSLSSLFWGGFATIGLVLPLAIEYFAWAEIDDAAVRMAATAIPGVLVIFGGFLLRTLILAVGIRSPLYVHAAFRVRPGE